MIGNSGFAPVAMTRYTYRRRRRKRVVEVLVSLEGRETLRKALRMKQSLCGDDANTFDTWQDSAARSSELLKVGGTGV